MKLAPGFRFHPTDEELIMYYLKRKVMGKKCRIEAISELNINKFSPWDLPDKSCLKSKDREWYFFCPTERKYASGSRMKRATESGYWKTTGKERPVVYNERVVGMIKSLVFHIGSAPRGKRTDWMIYEYRIVDEQLDGAGITKDAYVLCKVFHKNGPGPKNGAQYGAPFNEEEWDDDDDDEVNHNETFPFCAAPATASTASMVHLPQNANNSVLTNVGNPESTSIRSFSEPDPSSIQPPVDVVLRDLADDDIFCLLGPFGENGPTFPYQNHNNEMVDNGNDIYNGLGDLNLGNWPMLGDSGLSLPAFQEAGAMLSADLPVFSPDCYVELNDLEDPLDSSAEVAPLPHDQTADNNSNPLF